MKEILIEIVDTLMDLCDQINPDDYFTLRERRKKLIDKINALPDGTE